MRIERVLIFGFMFLLCESASLLANISLPCCVLVVTIFERNVRKYRSVTFNLVWFIYVELARKQFLHNFISK